MQSHTKYHYIGDERITFSRLNLAELSPVQEDLQAIREKNASDIGSELKFSPADLFDVKLNLRSRKPTIQDLIVYANQPDGALSFLKASLTKSGYDAAKQKQIINDLNSNEAIMIARMLVVDQQEIDEKKEAPEVPLSGSVVQSSEPAPSVEPSTPTEHPKEAKSTIPAYGSQLSEEELTKKKNEVLKKHGITTSISV